MSLRPFAGVYVPQCTPFGNKIIYSFYAISKIILKSFYSLGYYKVVQVHGSTGHSWCVNPENGEKVESSDVAPGAGAPQCGSKECKKNICNVNKFMKKFSAF